MKDRLLKLIVIYDICTSSLYIVLSVIFLVGLDKYTDKVNFIDVQLTLKNKTMQKRNKLLRWKDGQTYRKTDRRTWKQTERLTNKQTDKQRDRHKDKSTNRQMERWKFWVYFLSLGMTSGYIPKKQSPIFQFSRCNLIYILI